MRTNKLIKVLAVLSVFGMIQTFAATIVGSKHDLQSSTSNTIKSTGTTEICVFCHTPHASNTAFLGAPLWNKETTAVTYKMYGTTLAGTTSESDVSGPSNSSKACLSCHDGVSAINSVVNAPGSGSSVSYLGMNGSADGVQYQMPDTGVTNIGEFGTTAGQADLRNDHPVSIEYVDGKASLNPKAGVFGANNSVAYSGTWTTPDGTQNIASVLRDNGGTDMVECSSCHDPHLGGAGTQTFLRTTNNTGSVLCLGCHAK